MIETIYTRCLIALLLLLFTSCGDSYEDKYSQITKYENEGKTEKAISKLLSLNKEYPEDIYVKMNLGLNYSELKNYNEAIKWYQEVLKIDGKNELALFNISINYSNLERFKESYQFINELYSLKGGGIVELTISKTNPIAPNSDFVVPIEEIVFEKAMIELNLENHEKAYVSLNFCIDRDYNLSESFYWRGVVLYNANRQEEACQDFLKSSNLGNSDASDLILKHCK